MFPLLLRMAVPAAVGMMVNALYNVVDTVFVGQGVGAMGIAALSIVFPIQMIASAFAQAIGVGTASVVSRRLGERRPDEAARAVGTAYAFTFAAMAAVIAALYLFMEPVLGFFGASEGIMPYARRYLEVVAAGFFFFALSMCASSLLRAEGHARASMTGMLLGAGLNVALDPLFIFGFRMGIAGAAWATVLSQAASFLYLLSVYLRGRSHVPLLAANLRVRPAILAEAAVLGAPAFIQTAGMSILALMINRTLGAYGGDGAIGIYGMVHKFVSIIIMPVLGIAQGFQPIAGYNYGAGNWPRVRESLRVATLTAVGVSLAGYAVMMLVPRAAMGLFSSDAGLVAAAARVLRIMTVFIPLAAVQICGSTYFQAIGKRFQSLALGLSRQFLILIPLILTLPRFLGVDGVWVSYPIADLLATAITGALVLRELRKLGHRAEGNTIKP